MEKQALPSWMKKALLADGPEVKLKRKTPAQKKALERYNFCLREEDRYLGSVFANEAGQRRVEAATKAAHDECVRLGMTHQHGL